MSNIIESNQWTKEQIELIKSTVAKNATDEELKLFLYRCKKMDLDPLKPGQIYFIKYNQSTPGTIVVGIDGFRSKAAKTGKHCGTKRGVIRDEENRCIGAWCEVFRSDWRESAKEEVALKEYDTGKAMWMKMPETMIKKVAEAAALRMAFPDELGGMYTPEEMSQAEPLVIHKIEQEQKSPPNRAPQITYEVDPEFESAPEPSFDQSYEQASEKVLNMMDQEAPQPQIQVLSHKQVGLLKMTLKNRNMPWAALKSYVKQRFNKEDPLLMTNQEFNQFLGEK